MNNSVVSIVFADGMVPLGARASADTVVNKSRSHIYMCVYIYVYLCEQHLKVYR